MLRLMLSPHPPLVPCQRMQSGLFETGYIEASEFVRSVNAQGVGNGRGPNPSITTGQRALIMGRGVHAPCFYADTCLLVLSS